MILSHGSPSPSFELPLSFLILDLDVDEKFRRGDGFLTARDCDHPVPGARAVHPFLGYLYVCSTELLDLNDRLPSRSQDGADQALADLYVHLRQLVRL